jgi:hypothetical protein
MKGTTAASGGTQDANETAMTQEGGAAPKSKGLSDENVT